MPLNFQNIILILGAAQGFLLAILILLKHGRLYANRFLGSLMLFYSIILVDLLLQDLGFYANRPHLKFIGLGFPFVVGPLHYLYAKYLVYPSRKLRKIEWLHFLPLLLFKIYLLPDFLQKGNMITAVFAVNGTGALPFMDLLLNWAIIIQIMIYLFLTLFLISRYARDIKNQFSNIEKIRLDWLRNITLLAMSAWIIFLTENAFLFAGIHISHLFNLSSMIAGTYVYLMGYLGLFKSEIFSEPAIAASISLSHPDGDPPEIEDQSNPPKSAKKYEKSGLSPENARKYLQKLLHLMEKERPYRNSELTLQQLADMLFISPHNLSEVINTQLNQNFFDFINFYRVEEVKRDLIDSNKRHLKILSIALDAGFNSKTSFNTIFKKHTGQTPSEYRDQAASR